jgi:hypothetical protein
VERAHERVAHRSPREASRSGRDRRRIAGARNTRRLGRFTSPDLHEARGYGQAQPSALRSPGSASHCAERCFGHRPASPSSDGAWVLHDWRGNTFRFVVCRYSIQGATALQPRPSNQLGQPHEEQSAARSVSRRVAAKAALDHDAVGRHDARPAGTSSPTRAIAAGVRLKWCGDELDRPGRASHLVRDSTVLPRKGWLSRSRARCREAALNEQGTRGFRRRALNRSQLEGLGLGGWCSHQPVAAVTAEGSSSRSERVRGEVRVVCACPRIRGGHRL